MIDQTDDQKKAVQFRCITLGFLASGLGIALLLVDSTLELAYILSFAPQIRKLLVHPVWVIISSGAITTLTFIGSYLLWRRWNDPAWIGFSTLLLVMHTTHVALWLAENHPRLGLPDQQFDHEWLRIQVSQVLNWSEFVIWVRLIRIFSHEHAERLIPERVIHTQKDLSWLGLIISIVIAVVLTDWSNGWPLSRVLWLSPLDSLMLATVSTMMTASASLQLMIYLLKSSRITYLCDQLTRPSLDDLSDWYQDHWNENPWGKT